MHKNLKFLLIPITASVLLMTACSVAVTKEGDIERPETPTTAEPVTAPPEAVTSPSESTTEQPTEVSTEPQTTTEATTEAPVTTVTTTEATTEATTVATTTEATTTVTTTEAPKTTTEAPTEPPEEEIIEETKPPKTNAPPAVPNYPPVSAPGIKEMRNDDAVIDYSNSSDGYVMVKFLASTSNRIKTLVTGPTTQYQYEIVPDVWAALPLSDGNGSYTIGVWENVKGTQYAQVITTDISVSLTDEFAPFLRSNQYVDFEDAPNTIKKASELCGGIEDTLEKVAVIYDYVVENLTYDYDKASSVQSGYLPDLDDVLDEGEGICFDYAGLMTGMLRSQGVPCKLVIGYVDTDYHAWISVWTQEDGWVESAIYFNGKTWQRMDPTFASTGNRSDEAMEIINNESSYVAKYIY